MALIAEKLKQIEYIIYIGHPGNPGSHKFSFHENISACLLDETPDESTYNLISSTLQPLTARLTEKIFQTAKLSSKCPWCKQPAKHAGHRILPLLCSPTNPATGEKMSPCIIDVMVPHCGGTKCNKLGDQKTAKYLAVLLGDIVEKKGFNFKIQGGERPCMLPGCGLLATTKQDPDDERLYFCAGPWCKKKFGKGGAQSS